ncbi:MAG: SLBB domain-containing protein [Bacteroidota bacterium]
MLRAFSPTFLTFLFLFSVTCFGQDISNLGSVDIDDLSDEQIEAYVKRAQDSGLTLEQLELLARQRGMSSTQIAKLRQRILTLQSGGSNSEGVSANDSRLREEFQEEEERLTFFDDLLPSDTLEDDALPIFGASIFENALTFQAPVNVATPENYLLGPGDEIVIDIYGASEITYQQTVSPDGKILISGVGPISVSGISVKAATARVFDRISSIYAGLRGSRPNTFMELSVGKIKTISINVVGNVKRPGTYAISSFSSAFNALYEAGGPSEIGSMREIEIIRAGENIATLDVYRYFFLGDAAGNPQLQDGDAVVVRTYANRVAFTGEVKQPAYYEMKAGETIKDLLRYSGGPSALGYTEFFTVFRQSTSGASLRTIDPLKDEIELTAGDSIFIPPTSKNYSNRVTVEGAVKQPGFYELSEGMMLSELLSRTQLRRDAYMKRGNVIRLNPDLTFSNVTFNPAKVLKGEGDLELLNEDLVKIPSLFDIEAPRTVSLLGEVRKPGEYPFVAGMTVEDLIAISGGLKLTANTSKVEVARRLEKDSDSFKASEIFEFSIAEDLSTITDASTFQLQPFDLVTIKASALFRTQKKVKIEGEVMRPGMYALETEQDRLTDLIQRAGGFTSYAYPEGASLVRDLPHGSLTEDEKSLIETTSTQEGDYFRQIQLESLIARDSLDTLNKVGRKETVGILLDKALNAPDSKFNITMLDGDILSIPKRFQTVRVRGEVLFPTRVSFDASQDFSSYISQAGGFSDKSRPGKSYIVYPNGRAERTKRFLFFRNYPKVVPGADIFVPEKPLRRPLTTGEILGITSGLASLSLVILQIINITN